MEHSILKAPAAHPQLVALDQRVFAYAGDNERGADFAEHADGVVSRGKAGFTAARLCATDAICMVDPENYAHDRKDRAQCSLIPETPPESVLAQVHAGAACLLSPARFPGDRDTQSIKNLLNDGEAFIEAARDEAPSLPAFVVVVIRYDELADGRWVQPIRTSGLPIATVFAAYTDPLAQPAALEGAIRVMEAAEAAFALRCDISVAGLMALEATAGAIGTNSAMRHLWLGTPRSPGGKVSPSVFVPAIANWMKLSFVEQATADPDLDDIFRCVCSVCGPQGDVRRLHEATKNVQDAHSIAASVGLAHEVLKAEDPVSAWQGVCRQAIAAYDELQSLGISGPTKPESLRAWLSLLG